MTQEGECLEGRGFGDRSDREPSLKELEWDLLLAKAKHMNRQLEGSALTTTDRAIPLEQLERWLARGLGAAPPCGAWELRLPDELTDNVHRFKRWLGEARGVGSAPPRETWGLGILDELEDNVNSCVMSNKRCGMLTYRDGWFYQRIKLRELKRSFERLRGSDSPVSDTEKRIDKMLRERPNPSERGTREMHTVERDNALLNALGEITSFLSMAAEFRETPSITNQVVGCRRRTITTCDSDVAEIRDIMSAVIQTAKKYLDHTQTLSCVTLSAEAEPVAKMSIFKRPSRHIPIANEIEQDISWVLTTATHKVCFEVGIDGIRLGMDGVDIGAVLKVTRAEGEGEVLTQKGSVAAWGNMKIPVTNRNDHFITIFDKNGLHCENMPIKAGKTIRVKDEVYFERFRRMANESNGANPRETQGWWQTVLSYFRS